MPDADEESDLPLSPRTGAWLLGVVAVACCVRLAVLAAGDGEVRGEHFVWLAVGVIAATFSAACAVVAGLKTTESRNRGG